MFKHAQWVDGPGFEVSSAGNTEFSPLYAKLRDGRTIEEAYQLDVKGYRARGITNWRLAKGKPPLDKTVDLWAAYLGLWQQWARENPDKIDYLRSAAQGKTLTDQFSGGSDINQARALACILNEDDE